MNHTFDDIPESDEPVTAEDLAAIAEAEEDLRAGRFRVVHPTCPACKHPCECDGLEGPFCEEYDGSVRMNGCCRECRKAMPCPTVRALDP